MVAAAAKGFCLYFARLVSFLSCADIAAGTLLCCSLLLLRSLSPPRRTLIQHLLRVLPWCLIGNASLAAVEIAAHIAPYHGTEIGDVHRPQVKGCSNRPAIDSFAFGLQRRPDVPGYPDRKRHRFGEYRRP
jgi:hypothetical protein